MTGRQRLDHRGEYPPDWDAIGDRVRAEAGNRCIRCGHPQGDKLGPQVDGRFPHPALMVCTSFCTHPKDGKLRVLTVHHLDGNKSNCKWWNLLSLCQICHLQIQSRVVPERPWLFDHSPWFIPYVCGFYASFYGGIEITREEAEREPDRWLALNPARSA